MFNEKDIYYVQITKTILHTQSLRNLQYEEHLLYRICHLIGTFCTFKRGFHFIVYYLGTILLDHNITLNYVNHYHHSNYCDIFRNKTHRCHWPVQQTIDPS